MQESVKTLRAIMVEFLLPRIDFVIILDVIEGIRNQYSKKTLKKDDVFHQLRVRKAMAN